MPTKTASALDYLKTYPLFILPHHALTRVVYWLTRRKSRLTHAAIKWFVKKFNVLVHEAEETDLQHYKTFNEFFTRALKPSARAVASGESEIAAPADGRISAIGKIEEGRIFQAKGIDYSLSELLAGDSTAADRLADGRFVTIYLSPRDYHRLHMPLAGQLSRQSHVPGRLFSVGPHTVRTLPNLFTRNERVIVQFETDYGLMALVLVGAMNVAAIETVWHGVVTPPRKSAISHIHYNEERASMPVSLPKGAEMGRFNMGSTIIVLFENPASWRVDMQTGDAVQMGQFIGQVS